MADGRLGACKDCCKARAKIRWEEKMKSPVFAESERARQRIKGSTRRNGVRVKGEIDRKYKSKFPEKKFAINFSQRIPVRFPGNHAHHWSYNREHWMDVIELRQKLHKKAHKFMDYDADLFLYRTKAGVLLDTKAAHYDYILMIFRTK